MTKLRHFEITKHNKIYTNLKEWGTNFVQNSNYFISNLLANPRPPLIDDVFSERPHFIFVPFWKHSSNKFTFSPLCHNLYRICMHIIISFSWTEFTEVEPNGYFYWKMHGCNNKTRQKVWWKERSHGNRGYIFLFFAKWIQHDIAHFTHNTL